MILSYEGFNYRNSSSNIDSNNTYFIDTKLNEIIVILPANPEIGDSIVFFDYSNTWHINNLIIINNTKRIVNKCENLIINKNNIIVELIYYGDNSAAGWNIIVTNIC